MSKIMFSTALATGIKAIDEDHKLLIDVLNSLETEISANSGTETVGRALGALLRYVEEHFTREERIMAQHGYSHLGQHMRQHQQLMYSVHAIHQSFIDTPTSVNLPELQAYLNNWVTNHILAADVAFANFMRNSSDKQLNVPLIPELKAVTVRVPSNRINTILRCATILAENNSTAMVLADFVEKINNN